MGGKFWDDSAPQKEKNGQKGSDIRSNTSQLIYLERLLAKGFHCDND